MSRSKVLFIALITLAFGIAVVGDALAGEKFKARTVKQKVKWEQIEVGDQEGHIIAVAEAKGISTNMEGKWFADGWVQHYAALYDLNPKVGLLVPVATNRGPIGTVIKSVIDMKASKSGKTTGKVHTPYSAGLAILRESAGTEPGLSMSWRRANGIPTRTGT